MIEIFFIISQIFILFALFSLNIFILNTKYLRLINFSFLENLTFNIIIQINFILILSLFDLRHEFIIKIYLYSYLIIFILYLFKWKYFLETIKKININIMMLVLISTIISLDIAHNLTLSWDAEKFWFYKVLNFFNNNSISNLVNLPNNFYPHLGTLLWATYWKISLIPNEYSGRIFFCFIYLLSIFLLVENLKLNAVLKLIFSLLFILLTYDYYLLFSGGQDIVIFSLICFLMNFIYRLGLNKDNQNFNLLVIFLLMNAMFWIKQDGLIFSLSSFLTIILFIKLERKKIIFFSLFFLSIYFLKLYTFKIYNFETSIANYLNLPTSLAEIFNKISIERFFITLKYIIIFGLKNYLFLIGIVFISLSLANKQLIKKIKYLYFFGFINLSFIFTIYFLIGNSQTQLIYFLKTGADRLLFSFSPFIFLLVIECINFFKSRRRI